MLNIEWAQCWLFESLAKHLARKARVNARAGNASHAICSNIKLNKRILVYNRLHNAKGYASYINNASP